MNGETYLSKLQWMYVIIGLVVVLSMIIPMIMTVR